MCHNSPYLRPSLLLIFLSAPSSEGNLRIFLDAVGAMLRAFKGLEGVGLRLRVLLGLDAVGAFLGIVSDEICNLDKSAAWVGDDEWDIRIACWAFLGLEAVAVRLRVLLGLEAVDTKPMAFLELAIEGNSDLGKLAVWVTGKEGDSWVVDWWVMEAHVVGGCLSDAGHRRDTGTFEEEQ